MRTIEEMEARGLVFRKYEDLFLMRMGAEYKTPPWYRGVCMMEFVGGKTAARVRVYQETTANKTAEFLTECDPYGNRWGSYRVILRVGGRTYRRDCYRKSSEEAVEKAKDWLLSMIPDDLGHAPAPALEPAPASPVSAPDPDQDENPFSKLVDAVNALWVAAFPHAKPVTDLESLASRVTRLGDERRIMLENWQTSERAYQKADKALRAALAELGQLRGD